ncbi:MAG TPA: rhodanese-like domain-containing protein [Spirochaetales bacterium]|nr:rhodanese-like domain-containing protein [Spirochaetales bacterium]
MKKTALAFALLCLVLAACVSTPAGPALATVPAPVASAAAKDSPITMANLDAFLFRPDVQVVDLRNFEEYFNSGYVRGAELIPFFQYLENRMATRGTVDGKASWDASLAKVNAAFPLSNYFVPGKTIVLFCASGTRAAFVKTLLDKAGYTVFNAGGFKEYTGAYKVLGDGVYKLPAATF